MGVICAAIQTNIKYVWNGNYYPLLCNCKDDIVVKPFHVDTALIDLDTPVGDLFFTKDLKVLGYPIYGQGRVAYLSGSNA